MAVLVRVTKTAEPIRQALRQEGIPCVSVGMNTLFDAPEAEAARQLFYFMVNKAARDDVLAAWQAANLGISDKALKAAVREQESIRTKMEAEDDEVRFSVHNIQRQFMAFLERINLREETVTGQRGEVAFYNLAKFSQTISDFENIYFHSKPVSSISSLRVSTIPSRSGLRRDGRAR